MTPEIEKLVERAIVLLDTIADYGFQRNFEDGSLTPNAVLCKETARHLRDALAQRREGEQG